MRRRGEAAALLMVLLSGGTAAAQNTPAGDPVVGQEIFKKCQTCHSAEIGVNKIGPSLWNVIGRQSATVPDYPYSKTMQNTNKTWDAAALDVFLADPRHVLSGTRMMFQGLPDPKDRADVIAFLTTLQ